MAPAIRIPDVPDDDLPKPDVGSWALEKYARVWLYDKLFATGMKNLWECRVYIDLYSGSGKAQLHNSDRVVPGSPLLALLLPDRFDRYMFCDSVQANLNHLEKRVAAIAPEADVEYVHGDVNHRVASVLRHIPQHTQDFKVLSFCFVDPYSLDIAFSTIRRLATNRAIDFMILLALGMDANRNLTRYIEEESTRIAAFLGVDDWRDLWAEAQRVGTNFMYFMASLYAQSMAGIGYLPISPEDMHPVRSDQRNLPLYYLAFFSKNERGYRFWKEVLKYSTEQTELPL